MASDADQAETVERRTAAEKLLALVGAFAHGGGALTLSELSRHADLPLTTAHRLTRELLSWGGIEQASDGRYRLSSKFLELTSISSRALEVRERALPHLLDLQQQTGLSVQLSRREGDHAVFLESLRTMPTFSGEGRIGGRLPLHATGGGLVLLAYADAAVVDECIAGPLHRYTPYTPVDADEIRELLAGIRARRHAITSRTLSLNAGTVSAPVSDDTGEVIAAVDVIFLLREHDPAPLVPQVLETAQRISNALVARRSRPDPRAIEFRRRQAGLI